MLSWRMVVGYTLCSMEVRFIQHGVELQAAARVARGLSATQCAAVRLSACI